MPSTLEAVRQVLILYPQIYFACHTRHVRDPQSQRLLSRHQASILDHLDELDPTTVNDLSRHMGVTPAGVRLREAKSVLDPVRVEQVLAHLSPADRDAALRGLDLLARASEKHMKLGAKGRS